SFVVGHGATHRRRTSDDGKWRGAGSGSMSWRGHTAERPSLSRAASESGDAAVQIVLVGAFDFGGDNVTDVQRAAAGEVDRAVDLGGVCPGTTLRHGRPDLVDDDLLARADLALQAMRRDLLLSRHQRVPALLLDLVRH